MKRCIALLLILSLCLSCAACGTTQPDSQKETETETVIPTESESSASTQTESVGASESETAVSTESEKLFTKIDRYVLTTEDELYITKARRKAYKKALKAIFNHKSKVKLTDSYDDNLAILGYLQSSPYTFVLSSFDLTSDHKSMYFKYKYSEAKCKKRMNYIDRQYLKILNEIITPDMTELEKVLAVHKYFAANISYDYDWVDALNMSDEKYLFPDIVIYKALKTGKGVCHTYSYLCQFAFQQLGIDCVRATSVMTNSDDGHMWLIVWIDGIPYHMDATWDSGADGVALRYFGMTDTECCDRGVEDQWACSIDSALDITCTDYRFEDLRDVTDYTLIGDHKMEVTRENGTTDIVDLTLYE